MKRLALFLAAILLAAVPLWAQPGRTTVTITTFALLPATCDYGQVFIVTDANSNCSAGSGAVRVCICNATGNGYVNDPGTPGPDSVTTSEILDDTILEADLDMTDTAADEDVLTFESGAGGDFEWHSQAEVVAGGERGRMAWDVMNLFVDGTKCKPPLTKQINSGPVVGTTDCDDHADSTFYGHIRLANYKGGTLVATLEAINVNATPSGDLDFDISGMCRGAGDLVDGTWGTAANAVLTFDTQFDLQQGTTAAITPNGSCVSGDTLFLRGRMDDVATTTEVADVEIIGLSISEQ